MKIKQEKQFLVSVEKFKGIPFSLPYSKLLSSYFGIKRKNRAQFRYGLVVFIDSALDYQLSPFFYSVLSSVDFFYCCCWFWTIPSGAQDFLSDCLFRDHCGGAQGTVCSSRNQTRVDFMHGNCLPSVRSLQFHHPVWSRSEFSDSTLFSEHWNFAFLKENLYLGKWKTNYK